MKTPAQEEEFVKAARLVPLPRTPSIKDMLAKFISDKVLLLFYSRYRS